MKAFAAVAVAVSTLLHPCYLCAEQVNQTDIEKAAVCFLNRLCQGGVQLASKEYPVTVSSIQPLFSSDSGEARAYIVHTVPQGFLVLSADRDMPPVLAYSFSSNWSPDTSSANVLYHMLKRDVKAWRKAFHQGTSALTKSNNQDWKQLADGYLTKSATGAFDQWPKPGTTSTGGWVETTWHQYYNSLLPIDPTTNKRCIVGCGACAMAQIVNYHQYIGFVRFGAGDRYTSNGDINIDADSTLLDFPSFNTLNRYLENIRDKYDSNVPLTGSDIAALSFACGISVTMDYTSEISGTGIDRLTAAFLEHFGYASAEAMCSTDMLYRAIQDDIKRAMPVLGAIAGSVDSDVIGHFIVIDGYNTENFYHMNYGWGSDSPDYIADAWYRLYNMGGGYTQLYETIVNIAPFHDMEIRLAVDKYEIDFPPFEQGMVSEIETFILKNCGQTARRVDSIVGSQCFQLSLTGESFYDSLGAIVIEPREELYLYCRSQSESSGYLEGQITLSYAQGTRLLQVAVSAYCTPSSYTRVDRGAVSGVWQKESSPYIVHGDIMLKGDSRLIIEPGVDIVFRGRYGFDVPKDAQLIAKGAEDDSIRFWAPSSEGWYGLHFIESSNDDTLAYCVISRIRGSDSYSLGDGAIECTDSSPVITHSTISENQMYWGGALGCAFSSLKISHCTFKHNRGGLGGALSLLGSTVEMRNCLFVKNQATNGSIAFLDVIPSFVGFVNVTIADNTGNLFYAGYDRSRIVLKNSIIWSGSDSHYILRTAGSANKIFFSYSNVDTLNLKLVHGQAEVVWDRSITEDPLFTDPGWGDYTLQSGSPCKDSGDPDPQYNDVEDPTRPGYALWPAQGGSRNDMGAYGGRSESDVDLSVSNFQPSESIILQNYPNPFNAETTIEYRLSQKGRVRIVIYNLLGERIRTLVDRVMYVGFHHVVWDGRDRDGDSVSSGIYFCRVESGGFRRTRKMILAR